MNKKILKGLTLIENSAVRRMLISKFPRFNIILKTVFFQGDSVPSLDVTYKVSKGMDFMLVDNAKPAVYAIGKEFKRPRFFLILTDKHQELAIDLIKRGFFVINAYPLKIELMYYQIIQHMKIFNVKSGRGDGILGHLNWFEDSAPRSLRVVLRKSGQRLDFIRIGQVGFLQVHGKVVRFSSLEAAVLEQLFIGYKADGFTHLSHHFGNLKRKQLTNTIVRIRQKLASVNLKLKIKGVYGLGYVIKELVPRTGLVKSDKTTVENKSIEKQVIEALDNQTE